MDQDVKLEDRAGQIGFNSPFLIVTPTFNSEHYLDETIISVISQSGPFEIIYHVQDGGSTDRTLEILRRWKRVIDRGDFPINCNGLRFSFASERDGGMYQAINRGISAARPQGLFLMGWVNSDDRLAPGALATLEVVYQTFPEVRFTTARVAMIDDRGSLMGVNLPIDYNRAALARGDHDGRTRNFVMQEGTFWRSDLWDAVGGLDERFRLAGDWDLWRRFGEHAALYTIDTLIGFHRRRPGQLSAEMDRYYAEVDAALPLGGSMLASDEPDVGMIRFDLGKKRWLLYPNYGRRLDMPLLQDANGDREETVRVTPLTGVRRSEGPYPEGGLPAGMRWVDDTSVTAEVVVPVAGRWTMTLRMRNWRPRLKLRISREGAICYDDVLSAGEEHAENELRTSIWLEAGRNLLSIEASGEVGEPGSWLFIILDWYVHLEAPRQLVVPDSALARRLARNGTAWPRISIVVPTFNQGHFIEETLRSLIDQNYPDLEIIVMDGGSTDATRDILARYADHLAYYRSAPDGGQSAAINAGFSYASGDILGWLNSDDLLAKDALFAIAFAFSGRNAPDVVAGICTSFDKSGLVRRHLPCLPDGPLPLAQILDIEGSWLQGRFFHQPEVFFSRSVWEAAGAHVDEQLHYSMDYDLWARLAKSGARIQVIGAEIARFRIHAAQKTSSPEVYSPELRAHAAQLADTLGTAPAMRRRDNIQSILTIAMFNDYGYKYGAGAAHRRLATALSGFGHRVVPIAYADFDMGQVDRVLTGETIVDALLAEDPDLVILGNQHAIEADFLAVLEILVARGVPTVFFAHDEWIVTGRCGYPGACTRLESACDQTCPTAGLYPALDPQLVNPAFKRKRALMAQANRDAPFAIFTNSEFMSARIERLLGVSASPPVRAVRLGVDCTIFHPQSRVQARRRLGVPENAFIVLTAAADMSDERKGFSRAVKAFEALASPDKLLLVMGLIPDRPHIDGAVHYSGHVTDEQLAALHYAAADVLVSASNQEAFGQVLIEAAASGCPALALEVGGTAEAVRHGETGILVPTQAPAALARALQHLHDDRALRERLGLNGVLHARTRYSLEACGWSFLTMLEELACFRGVPMAPNLVLSTDETPAPFLAYLTGERATPPPEDGWETGHGLLREKDAIPEIGLEQGYAWLLHPTSRVFVRAQQFGVQTLHIHGRSTIPGQEVTVSVNGEHAAVLHYDQDDARVRETRQVRAALVPGMNRIDFAFAIAGGFEHEPRPLTFRLEGIDVGERDADQGSSWQPLSGFGQLEGPYLEHNITRPFRWIEKPTARLRVYSGKSIKTQLRIVCRNHLAGQWIEIAVNGATVGTVKFENAAFIELYEILLPIAVVRGWNVIVIKVGQSGFSLDERELLVAVDSVELVEAEMPIGRVRRYFESDKSFAS
jgi:glycosyltransferase involved in cell wall biosynthesis